MKKIDVKNLFNSPLMAATSYELDAKYSYPLYKLKSEITRINEEIEKERVELVKSIFGESSDENINELYRLRGLEYDSLEQQDKDKLNDLSKKEEQTMKLINEMFQQDVTINGVKPIPYDEWCVLIKENKNTPYIMSADNERKETTVDVFSFPLQQLLEGVLWEAPKDYDF